MRKDDFADRVERERAAHPLWFDLEPDQRATDDQLHQVERELNARPPEDFAWFLRTFGGGDFAFATVYSADPRSALYLASNQPEPRPPDFLAVSDDGTGNLFGFRAADGKYSDEIHIWDHETGEIQPTSIGGFLDFIARMAFEAA